MQVYVPGWPAHRPQHQAIGFHVSVDYDRPVTPQRLAHPRTPTASFQADGMPLVADQPPPTAKAPHRQPNTPLANTPTAADAAKRVSSCWPLISRSSSAAPWPVLSRHSRFSAHSFFTTTTTPLRLARAEQAQQILRLATCHAAATAEGPPRRRAGTADSPPGHLSCGGDRGGAAAPQSRHSRFSAWPPVMRRVRDRRSCPRWMLHGPNCHAIWRLARPQMASMAHGL